MKTGTKDTLVATGVMAFTAFMLFAWPVLFPPHKQEPLVCAQCGIETKPDRIHIQTKWWPDQHVEYVWGDYCILNKPDGSQLDLYCNVYRCPQCKKRYVKFYIIGPHDKARVGGVP